MRRLPFISSLKLVLALALCSAAQAQVDSIPQSELRSGTTPTLARDLAITSSPQLSPDLALATYQRGLELQANQLAGYTAISRIDAELPDSAQKAEYELQQHYSAPASLEFSAVHSSGDAFVKSNVIIRLLQSEVDHVRHHEQSETAINSANYRFSYKGASQLNGTPVHVYEVKPHAKRVGLFKGKIYVDAVAGHLLRAQGRIVRSPSFFIKKIDFVQDYAMLDGFTLPVHTHSEAQTRIIGRAVVDITNRDYHTESAAAMERPGETSAIAVGTD